MTDVAGDARQLSRRAVIERLKQVGTLDMLLWHARQLR